MVTKKFGLKVAFAKKPIPDCSRRNMNTRIARNVAYFPGEKKGTKRKVHMRERERESKWIQISLLDLLHCSFTFYVKNVHEKNYGREFITF